MVGLLHDAVLGGRVFFARDVHLQWQTQAEGFARALFAGSWPVWNPWLGFGQPLWANANNQVLYPFTWLNAVVPPGPFYTLYVVAHLLLAGAGLQRLARAWGASPLAAFTAAACWIFSGPFLSLTNLWNHLAGAAWLPWAVLAAVRLAAAVRVEDALGTRRAVAGWGAAIGVAVLAGSAEYALLGVLASGVFWLGALFDAAAAPARRRLLGAALAAGLLAVALSAGQWLPTLEVARRALRAQLPAEVQTFFSLHPAAAAHALVPVLLNEVPWRPEVREWLLQSRSPLLLSLYLGLPALPLVLAAPPGRTRRLLVLLGTAGLLLALGRHTPVYAAVATAVPVLKTLRYPVKAMVLVGFAWALLAGLGLDAWRERLAGRSRVAALALSASIAAGVLLLAVASRVPGGWAEPFLAALPDLAAQLWPTTRRLAVSGGLTLATAAVLLALRGRPQLPRAALALLAGAPVASLLFTHQDLCPTADPGFYSFRPATLAAARDPAGGRTWVYEYFFTAGRSREHLGRDRPYGLGVIPPGLSYLEAEAVALRTYLLPPIGGAFGLEGSYDIDLVDLSAVGLNALRLQLRAAEGTPAWLRLLQAGGVSRVVALHDPAEPALTRLAALPSLFPEAIQVFAVPDPLPRALVVPGARRADDEAALALLAAPDFDLRRELLLAEGEPHAPAPGFTGTAHIASRTPDRVLVDVAANGPGYLLLLDAWDAGWQATVDGRPAPVARANVGFRAVPVPAGSSRVDLAYRPWSVPVGLALTLLAVAGLGVSWHPAILAGPRARNGRIG